MMPISTPPNAVVFASGHIKVGQMMRAGIWVNLLSALIIVAVIQLLGTV
jgi:sodium-dependent dicarboxylate transporter 2/3/5